jgi:hypothetical protein
LCLFLLVGIGKGSNKIISEVVPLLVFLGSVF